MNRNTQQDIPRGKADAALTTDSDPPLMSVSSKPMTPPRTVVAAAGAPSFSPLQAVSAAAPAPQKKSQQRRRICDVPVLSEKSSSKNSYQQESSIYSGSSGSQRSQGSPSRRVRIQGEDFRAFDQIQAEHLYLVTNLQQQEVRIRTLVAALATVQAQLQDAPTPVEARRLRKNVGFIRSKIADAEQQERMALLGLGRVNAELQSRYRHLQLHQQLYQQQQQILTRDSTQWLNVAIASPQGQMPAQLPPTPYLTPYEFGAKTVGEGGTVTLEHQKIAEAALVAPATFVVSPVTPGITAMMPASPESTFTSPAEDCMSPMSPLAPIFEPGASLFSKHTEQGSLEGISFGVAEATGAHRGAAFKPRSAEPVPTTVSDLKEVEPIISASGLHYVFDSGHESCDSDVFLPENVRTRRGSHSSKQHTQVREKRMSLPPVRFSWPGEKE